MTASPRIEHDDRPPLPAAGRGYGWRDHSGRERHAGIGTREAADRHDDYDDTDMPLAVPDEDNSRAADDVGGTGERRPLLDNLRFLNEDVASLRKLLRFARTAHYNMSHIKLVRAANIAFFCLITAPVLTVAFFLIWAYFLRPHRALTALGITLAVGTAANPLADWAVWDGLDLMTWWPTGWQWVAGGAFAFVVATVLVLRIEPCIERWLARRAEQRRLAEQR